LDDFRKAIFLIPLQVFVKKKEEKISKVSNFDRVLSKRRIPAQTEI
jgi:hypothetical protein